MRYKIAKPALLARMSELGQDNRQRVLYLRHTIATLMTDKEWKLFNIWASSCNVYWFMLDSAFEIIRYSYSDYLIIVQSTQYEYTIEIRKK